MIDKDILLSYGFIQNTGDYPEVWEILKDFGDKIFINIHPDPINKMLRPYIYVDDNCILFAINLPDKNYINGFRIQLEKQTLKKRLSIFIDTWAIDMCMDLWFNDLSEKDKKDVYLENRKRKEFDFEDYDKKFGYFVNNNSKSDKEVIIYRGVATKSNKKKTGKQSWTTDYKTAEFFANRFKEPNETQERYILKGKCKEKDIIKKFDSESEILILAENVKIIDKIKV